MSSRKKSVEQKLFEANQHCRGVRLTLRDVHDLLGDGAISQRIWNAATVEGGGEEDETVGGYESLVWRFRGTWKQFCKRAADGEGQS